MLCGKSIVRHCAQRNFLLGFILFPGPGVVAHCFAVQPAKFYSFFGFPEKARGPMKCLLKLLQRDQETIVPSL